VAVLPNWIEPQLEQGVIYRQEDLAAVTSDLALRRQAPSQPRAAIEQPAAEFQGKSVRLPDEGGVAPDAGAASPIVRLPVLHNGAVLFIAHVLDAHQNGATELTPICSRPQSAAIPMHAGQDPTGLALNGSPGREVARKMYGDDF
jgi:hypothetical protein